MLDRLLERPSFYCSLNMPDTTKILFEKLIVSRLRHLDSNEEIANNQFGFRRDKFTFDAMAPYGTWSIGLKNEIHAEIR